MKIKGKMWSGAAVTCSCLRPPDAEPPLTRRRPQTLHDLIFCPSVFVPEPENSGQPVCVCVRACIGVCEWGFFVVAIVFLVMLIKKLCCCDSEGRKMQQRHLLNVGISPAPLLWHFPHEWETTFFFVFLFFGVSCVALLTCIMMTSYSLPLWVRFFLLFYFSKTSILEVWPRWASGLRLSVDVEACFMVVH